MARTTIAAIFRESRGVVLLLMAVALLAVSVLALVDLQSVDAKEVAAPVSTAELNSVTEVDTLINTTSPTSQLLCDPGDPGLGLAHVKAACDDWYYWTALVASGWDGERQWFYYCRFMRLCGRVSTLGCWTETE